MKTYMFEILFDNGGGALLQTRRYVHLYDDGEHLATDVRGLLAGDDVAGWEGHQPEYRRDAEQWDKVMNERDVHQLLTLRGESLAIAIDRIPGHTQRDFVKALTTNPGAK